MAEMNNEKIRAIEKSLHSEKTLWQIWRSSLKIPFSRFNYIVLILVTLASCCDAVLASDVTSLIDFTRSAALAGVSSGLAVLGLLLAGFTVFATVSQPDLLLMMMLSPDRKSGLPKLKNNIYIFVRVFVILLCFTAVCFIVSWFGRKAGLMSHACRAFYASMSCELIARVGFVVVLTAHALAFLQIKSFVFNIVHSVMSYLRFHSRRMRGAPGSKWPPE